MADSMVRNSSNRSLYGMATPVYSGAVKREMKDEFMKDLCSPAT
jgi:hypothetical protein